MGTLCCSWSIWYRPNQLLLWPLGILNLVLHSVFIVIYVYIWTRLPHAKEIGDFILYLPKVSRVLGTILLWWMRLSELIWATSGQDICQERWKYKAWKHYFISNIIEPYINYMCTYIYIYIYIYINFGVDRIEKLTIYFLRKITNSQYFQDDS